MISWSSRQGRPIYMHIPRWYEVVPFIKASHCELVTVRNRSVPG
jgi:hypothetical protein